MSSRQHLRDFQRQLAEKLARSEREGRLADWLAMRTGDHHYLLPLSHLGEVVPHMTRLSLPHVKPWVLGVSGLRSGLCVLLDLGRWLGLPNLGEGGPATAPAWVSFAPALGVQAAFRVDTLLGLRQRAAFQAGSASASPALGLHAHWRDGQGQDWLELNLLAMAQNPDFLNIHQGAAGSS